MNKSIEYKECVVCYDETEIQYWDCGTCKNGFLCLNCMKSYNKKLCPLCKTVEGLCYCVNQDKLIIEFKNIVSKIKPHKIKTDNLFWLENSNYVIDSIDFWEDYSYENIILDFVDKEHRIKFKKTVEIGFLGFDEGMDELNNIDKIMDTMFKDFGGVVYAYSYTKMCNALKAFDHRYQEKFDWLKERDHSDGLEIWNLSDIFLNITGDENRWVEKRGEYTITFDTEGYIYRRFETALELGGINSVPVGYIRGCLEPQYEETGFTHSVISALQGFESTHVEDLLMNITNIPKIFKLMIFNNERQNLGRIFTELAGFEECEEWGYISENIGGEVGNQCLFAQIYLGDYFTQLN